MASIGSPTALDGILIEGCAHSRTNPIHRSWLARELGESCQWRLPAPSPEATDTRHDRSPGVGPFGTRRTDAGSASPARNGGGATRIRIPPDTWTASLPRRLS